MSITPSVAVDNVKKPAILSSDKTVFTVDDEGDGDYTSIKEAVYKAHPGYTIRVYSGTYYEKNIYIDKQGLTLQGIPWELGSGNDTGKPVVTSILNSYNYILYMQSDEVTITDFVIIDSSSPQATFPIRIWGDNCTFSYNFINGGWLTLWIGETLDYPNHYSLNTHIIGNTIENTCIGIRYNGKHGNISWNSFRRCSDRAIEVYYQSTSNVVSYNSIYNCDTGILYHNGSNSIISHNLISADTGIDLGVSNDKNINITMNQFQQCGRGILLKYSHSLIKVHQNNFIDNKQDIRFVRDLKLNYNYWLQPIFDENYYDSWKRFGSKWIRGIMILFWIPILGIPELWFAIPIHIPWFYPDLNPARKPYDIEGVI